MEDGNQKRKYNKRMSFFNTISILLVMSCNNGISRKVNEEIKDSNEKKVKVEINTKKEINNIEENDSIKLLDTVKLYHKRLIGEVILSKNKWYIISGKSCNQCDENISIYIFPENPKILDSNNTLKNSDRFTYPGRVLYYEDRSLIYESSTFFGKCLDDFDNVVIWIERGLNDFDEWEESVYMIELFNEKVAENRPVLEEQLLQQIDNHLANGMCLEIEEMEQISEP